MSESERQQFFEKYAPYAMAEQQRCGVPASITLAQMALESSFGTSTPALQSNNYFGIKAHDGYTQEGHYDRYTDDNYKEKFCRYQSVEESIADHSRLLTTEKYQQKISKEIRLHPSDSEHLSWIRGIKAAGYATDSNYVNKIESIISKFGLAEYDAVAATAKQQGVSINPHDATSQKPSGYLVNYREGNFTYPYDVQSTGNKITISSDYGWRKPPCKGASSNHRGIDIPLGQGTPLFATEDYGRVISVQEDTRTASGKCVKVSYDRDDGKQYIVSYMHLNQIDVKEGDLVKAGQAIGLSGNTGASTGPHLHMSVQYGSKATNYAYVDPKIYITELAVRNGDVALTMEKQGTHQDLMSGLRGMMAMNIPPITVPEDQINMSQLNFRQGDSSQSILEFMAKMKKEHMIGDIGGSSDVIADLVGAIFSAGIALVGLSQVTGEQQATDKVQRASAELDPATVIQRHKQGFDSNNAHQMASRNFEAECPEQTLQQHLGRA